MRDLVKNINSELINSSDLLIQYRNIKFQNEGYIVLFRVGEFYETYFDDAVILSEKCSVSLTHRHFKFGDVYLAGIPSRSKENYIKILLDKGFKVALCEEFQESSENNIRERKVVQKYTSGVLLDEEFLNPDENNFLCAIHFAGDVAELAFSDISTNQVYLTEISQDDLIDEILKFKPSEILLSSNCELSSKFQEQLALAYQDVNFTFLPKEFFNNSDAFCGFSSFVLSAILNYLNKSLNIKTFIPCVVFYKANNHLNLSYGALRNLEVLENMQNLKKEGTLFWVLDKTKTPIGRRLLEYSLKFPLISKDEILKRQEVVSYFIQNDKCAELITSSLTTVSDVSRIIIRIKNNHFKTKDFLALKSSISAICTLISKFNSIDIFNFSHDEMMELEALKTFLDDNISDDIINPINECANTEFSLSIQKIENILSEINSFEELLRVQTKIKKLKIYQMRNNKFIIEIPRSEMQKIQGDFAQFQVLSNCTRYTNAKLEKLSTDYTLECANKLAIQGKLINNIVSYLSNYSDLILRFSDKIALLDMLFAFSQIAIERNYICPKLDEKNLHLNCAKHPSLSLKFQNFQPTSFEFDDNLPNFVLLTGANMAGKSTLMRQIALISIMAQIGSYVPAKAATVPLFDKIFVRFGTLDNIYRNKSSFALEMHDVKQILNYATKNSLILLDELGKSTSTQDGSAIARAVSEYIINFIDSKTIFATHYHNLKAMYDENKDKIRPLALSVSSSKRILENGFLDKSFGIKIAEEMGLPKFVLERAISYASLNQ